jgi:hypothetical protein
MNGTDIRHLSLRYKRLTEQTTGSKKGKVWHLWKKSEASEEQKHKIFASASKLLALLPTPFAYTHVMPMNRWTQVSSASVQVK